MPRLLHPCGAALILLAAIPASFAALNGPVAVDGGLISGLAGTDPGISVFKGIPYAAPPVGDLRWRPPQPVVPWKGIRKADTFPPSDWQTPRSKKAFTYEAPQTLSEDCLYLNIWTGARSAGERRPVMLYIHGGSFTIGEGTKPGYNGKGLAEKGAVVVTINYRLNIFGFFAHPELARESARGVSGNYGLLDMIAAIKWTRRNIAAFGGNPDRITIFGESAGSVSVSALTTSPLIRGDICGAIAQSILYVKAPRMADLEKKGETFVADVGAHSVAELRRMPAKQLYQAYLQHGTRVLWWPVVDNWALTGDLLELEAKGQVPDIPVLTGSNADEGMSLNPPETLAGMAERLRTLYGPEQEKRFDRLYPADSDATALAVQNIADRDKIAWEHWRWAALRARQGRRTYVYFFTHAPPMPAGVRYRSGTRLLPEHMGAFHTADIHYIFNSLDRVDRPWKPYDRELARIMSSYWYNFAAKGDPNGPGLPPWPRFSPSAARPILELGDTVAPRPDVLSPAKADFWAHNYARNDCTWMLWPPR